MSADPRRELVERWRHRAEQLDALASTLRGDGWPVAAEELEDAATDLRNAAAELELEVPL